MKKDPIIYYQENAQFLLVQCVDEHDRELLDSEYDTICQAVSVPFMLAAVETDNWNDELSPWKAPAVFGNQDFGGGAGNTLAFITDELLPRLKRGYALPDSISVIIGGYSLAALFALWCGYQTDCFYGVAAASPSVWFDGWKDYAATHTFLAGCTALSLGDKEENTRHHRMATVGDNIRFQQALFAAQNIPSVLDWNEGNHFQDAGLRTAKTFIRLINR